MDGFLVFFKSDSDPKNKKDAFFHIPYAANEQDAHRQAYVMLMGDAECRKLEWKLDKIEVKTD